MGVTVDNYNAGPHVEGGTLKGFRLHLHRENQSIDAWSPEVTKLIWGQLVSVARVGDLGDLDAVGASIWPQWWVQNVRSREGGLAAVRLVLTV